LTKTFTPNLKSNWPLFGRGLVALAALVVFLPALATWFTGEDFSFILPASTGKPFYQTWQNLFYRPLPNLLWQFDYAVWGLSAPGYHLTNLIIHAANAGLVGWLVRKYVKSECAGLGAAVLFALTPVHTEPVVWLAGRPDLLATFFGLLTLVLARHFAETGKGWVYGAALAAFGAAIFSKESVAGLPFILVGWGLLTGGWPRSAQTWRSLGLRYLPFFGVEAVYWLARYAALGSLGSYGNGGWLNVPWNLTVGLWQPLLFPFNFDSAGWLVGGALSGLLLVFYGWLMLPLFRKFSLKNNIKPLARPLLLMYGGMAPALTLAPVGLDLSQARLLYLPSVGFCWLLALLFRLRLQPVGRPEVGPGETFQSPSKVRDKPAFKSGKLVFILIPGLIYLAGLWQAFSPWLEAGSEARATFDQLHRAGLAFQPGDFIYYEGLPDSYRGAYIWRNGLDEASTLLLGPGISGVRRLPDQLIDYGKAGPGRVWFVRFASNPSPTYLFSYSLSASQKMAPGQPASSQSWNLESCQAGEWQFTPTQGNVICQPGQGLYLQTGWQKTSFSLTNPTLKPPPKATGLEVIFTNYVDFDFQQPQIFSDFSLSWQGQSSPFQQPFELAADGKPHRYHFYLPLSPTSQGGLRLTFDFNKFRSNILWKNIEIRFITGQ
jgi:hypothetical protein